MRDARDDDAEGLISLIGGVFAEYPGCVMDVDGELPELRAIATAFRAWGGAFWVEEDAGRIVACGGYSPTSDAHTIELRKLYVHRESRRKGLGRAFCERVAQEARRRGATRVELWSDTRFTDAHRLYRKLGYVQDGATRDLHDKSDTVEYHFVLTLDR